MKDTQLYEQLLGLSKPWSVERVEVELQSNRITVRPHGGVPLNLCSEIGGT